MAKVDKRTISDNLDVEVTHVENGYTVACTNNNATAPLVIRLNFDNSSNVKVAAVAGVSKLITATVVEVTVAPSSKSEAATLTAIAAGETYAYKYTCATQLKKVATAGATATATATVAAAKPAPAAAAPAPAAAAPVPAATPAQKPKPAAPAAASASPAGAGSVAPVPEGTEETERKNLAEGLEILIHSINNGYNLQIDNSSSDSSYTVILDLEASENLVITAEGGATLDGKKVTIAVPPRAVVAAVNMPVDNWDLGSCELRYKAAIRKQQ